ncbi:MAG: universal stress protein [Acidimicrobiia bacterium]|nr:universal stress protein [Acidimicrobiia bacterium]
MKILIATDGTLDPLAVAEPAARLANDAGEITVLTVVEVPRRLLTDLRAVYGESSAAAPVDESLETAGHTTPRPHLTLDWPGDDTFLNRYVDDQKIARTESIVAALADRGITAEVLAVDSEDPVSAILTVATSGKYDVLCIGTHGLGRFDGLLGSTSTKLIRRSPCAVLMIRT